MGELLTQAEAAGRLGTSSRHLRRLRERGDIPTVRIGGLVRVDADDVAAYIAAAKETR